MHPMEIGAASGDRTFSTALPSVTYRKEVNTDAEDTMFAVGHCAIARWALDLRLRCLFRAWLGAQVADSRGCVVR